ncbi:hypothetical protein B0H13DRAFT_1895281 [Mycena leptocephala]|nr:hypothetical protein B0H13DRAFT_1895281 [Mycena leptocephala]
MDVAVSPAPVLPLDLERKIFEISACLRPVLIPKFMLVAWRVKEWVEPLLYRTIAVEFTRALDGYPIFTWDVLVSAMRSKPPSFFHYAVRNICLLLTDGVKAIVETLLGLCTRLHNLSLSPAYVDDDYDRAMPILMAPLPLAHIYGNLGSIFQSLPSTDPLFVHATHLGLRNWEGLNNMEIASRLSLMPHVTHLSFDLIHFISTFAVALEYEIPDDASVLI